MDNLAFLFGRMSERYDGKMQRICAYLKTQPHINFSTEAVRDIFDKLVELSEPVSTP